MTRQDFLRQISLGAAFVLTVPCLHSCDKDDDGTTVVPPADVDFTIDVTAEPFAADFAQRGYTIRDRVVVARLSGGGFAAASQVCSHEGNVQVVYDQAGDSWFCPVHGAEFERADGAPLNSITSRPLTIYPTSLSGNMLKVG